MTFPDSNALKVSLADLKDIVSRSRGEDNECVRLLSQIEALVFEIERKSQPDRAVPTPTSSISQSSVASVTL
jgi:hypothetical protein